MQAAPYVLLLLIAIYILSKSSSYVLSSLSNIARRQHIPAFLIAFVFLSIATSLPELTVGINSATAGVPELSLGDVLGTNIVNLTLVLGLLTVMSDGIKLKDYNQFKRIRLSTLVLVGGLFVLMLDGGLSRIDGVVLVSLYLLHLFITNRNKETKASDHLHKATKRLHGLPARDLNSYVIFAISSLVLILSAYLVVLAVSQLSTIIGVPEFLFGLFIVAIGTSLPELTIGLRSAKEGKQAISIGNLFGAVAINVTLVLGVVALMRPITAPSSATFTITAIMTLGVMLLIFGLLRKNNHVLSRKHGFLLLGIYVVFLLLQALYF